MHPSTALGFPGRALPMARKIGRPSDIISDRVVVTPPVLFFVTTLFSLLIVRRVTVNIKFWLRRFDPFIVLPTDNAGISSRHARAQHA